MSNEVEIQVHGSIFEPLTHLAQIGLARVTGGRLVWSREEVPRATVIASDPASALEDWAARRTSPGDWSQRASAGNAQRPAPMSAAFGLNGTTPTEPTDRNGWRWDQVYTEMSEIIDSADPRDLRTIGSLGQPSYWIDDKPAGQGNRMIPVSGQHPWQLPPNSPTPGFNLRACVWRDALPVDADQLIAQITQGIDHNHTSGGWSPNTTNAALGILAMEGVAVYPLSRQVHRATSTAAVMSRSTLLEISVPLFAGPILPDRLRTVLQDRSWLPSSARDVTWLRNQGVTNAVTFSTSPQAGGPQSSGRVCGLGTMAPLAELVQDRE